MLHRSIKSGLLLLEQNLCSVLCSSRRRHNTMLRLVGGATPAALVVLLLLVLVTQLFDDLLEVIKPAPRLPSHAAL